jgi:hypothetical protein
VFERETKVDIPAAVQPPGGSLACALERLDLTKATPGGLVDVAVGAQALMRWAEALQTTAIARLADHYTMADGEEPGPKDPKRPAGKHFGADDGSLVSEFLTQEVAAALSISKTAAGNKLGMALDLDQRLSDTRQAMRDGKLDGWKARLIADRTRALDAQRARLVERQVLGEAPALAYGKLRSRLDRLACAAAPDETAADAKAAFATRRIYRGEEPNGMAGLHVRMGADQATTVWNACDAKALASRHFAGPNDRRTLEQRRVDALVALCGDSLDRSLAGRFTPDQPPAATAEDAAAEHTAESEPDDLGAARGFITPADRTPTQAALARLASIVRRRCTINLTVGADILLAHSNSPAYLHGHGWTPAPAARRLLGGTDPVMRRLILDPVDGTPLDLSRKTYRPTHEVAEMARLLSTTCTFPGCGRDSSRCQLDHTDPHPKGRNGPGLPGDVHETSPTRLGPLCDTDHRVKTHGGWSISRLDNHRWEWVSPLGKVYYTFNETLSPRTLVELAEAEAAETFAREHRPPEPPPIDPDDPPPF